MNCESDVGNQPGDSRTRERRKLVVNVQPKVAEIEKQEPMVGNQEDPSVFGLLVNQLLQSTQGEILRRDRLSVVGPVCFSCGDGGHMINRCPQVNTDFPFLPAGWSMNMDNGQYRAKRMNQILAEEPGNEQRSEREGQPLGPPEIKAPLTQTGVSTEISNWRIPTENCKRDHWAADSQEFLSLETQQRTAGNTKRSAGLSAAEVGRRPTGPPTPVPRNLDRGMRLVKDFQSVPQKDRNTPTRGVQETIVTPLSALAENFIPRKTSRKPPTPQMPTDNELDRSFARTGQKKMETPQDIIEIDIATVGAASPTEIEKPVAMADVAGAGGPVVTRTRFRSVTDVAGAVGPAVTGAGGPVVTGTRFRSVTDVAGAGGSAVTGAGGPVITGTRFRSVTDVAGAGGPVVAGTRFRSVTDVAGAGGPAVTGADGPVIAGTQFLAVHAPFEDTEGDLQGDAIKVDQNFSTTEEDTGSCPLEHSGVKEGGHPEYGMTESDCTAQEVDIVAHPLEHSGVAEWAGISEGLKKRSPPESFEICTDPAPVRKALKEEPI